MINFSFDGKAYTAQEGDTLAAALLLCCKYMGLMPLPLPLPPMNCEPCCD